MCWTSPSAIWLGGTRISSSTTWKELFKEAGITKREDLPLWGCYENITNALQNYPIIPLDIPAPFNIGQCMGIDLGTGTLIWYMFDESRKLYEPAPHIDMRAEMDCLCAGSNDPGVGNLGASKGYYAKPIRVQIFDK